MKQPITKSEINYQWSKTFTNRLGTPTEVRTIKLTRACGLNGEPVMTIIKQLYPVLPNKSVKAKTQAVQAILLNLVCACIESDRTGQLTGFLHSRTTASYKLPKRYAVNSFSNKTMTSVLDDMAAKGLVDCYKGFKGIDHYQGLASFWCPTDAFRKLLGAWQSEALTVIWFNAEIELVELKDLTEKLIDYTDNINTFAIRQAVSSTNDLRLQHVWQYQPQIERKTHHNEITDRLITKGYITLAPQELICQRKFKGDFSTGGRFYAPFQQLTKNERATITIDGRPTIELDIKSAQPRILYNMRGLASPVDCYQIDGISRDVAKQLMLVALNAKTREEAVRALCIDLSISRSEVLDYLGKLTEFHKPISDSFYSSAWRIVQYQDGELTNDILNAALRKGIAVLPVHDSYIVDVQHRLEIYDVIQTAYKARFGYYCVIE
jgi:hypothetical protein